MLEKSHTEPPYLKSLLQPAVPLEPKRFLSVAKVSPPSSWNGRFLKAPIDR